MRGKGGITEGHGEHRREREQGSARGCDEPERVARRLVRIPQVERDEEVHQVADGNAVHCGGGGLARHCACHRCDDDAEQPAGRHAEGERGGSPWRGGGEGPRMRDARGEQRQCTYPPISSSSCRGAAASADAGWGICNPTTPQFGCGQGWHTHTRPSACSPDWKREIGSEPCRGW